MRHDDLAAFQTWAADGAEFPANAPSTEAIPINMARKAFIRR